MSLLTKTLGSVLEKTLLAPAEIVSIESYGRFRLIELSGKGLRGADWSPGDKLRVKLGDLDLRTYTPVTWDARKGFTRLVAWLPGRGPGSAWAEGAQVGQAFYFKGPKESLKLSKAAGHPVIFFGDETAVGAAAALRASRSEDRNLRFIFELAAPDEARAALEALGLSDAAGVGKTGDGSHLKAVRKQIQAWAAELGEDVSVFLVGNQESVKGLKSKLQDKLPGVKIKAKVYWREGKAGLD